MRSAPWFRGPLRANERRTSARRRNVQLLLVLVIVTAGLPIAFTPPAAANAVTAYGCTIDPEKPNDNDGKIIAKARFQCSSALAGRAIRTDLQQRLADDSYRTVAKSIVVRDVPGTYTGQWYGAGSDWVGGCKKVSGTRKFKSIIMVTDGEGNITETASNPEEFGRDCVDADDAVPLVALVVGSNSLDVCDMVEEELTDPNAEFTDPDVLFAQGNVEPCAGTVTTYVSPQADVEWTIAVQGIGDDLSSLPKTRSAGGGSETIDYVALTGNETQNQAAISAKEDEILNLFAADDTGDQSAAEVSSAQADRCERGNIGDRRAAHSRKKNDEPAFGGKRNGPKFRITIEYKRITCEIWQITDARIKRTQGTWPVRIDSANANPARQPGEPGWWNKSYSYGCKDIRLDQTIGWPNDQQWKWEILPGALFKQGLFIRSADLQFAGPYCDWRSVHTTTATRLKGKDR